MDSYAKKRRYDGPSEDSPVFSRLFVVCGKKVNETKFREMFEEFGRVDDIFFPVDHRSGESKGVAYVKYSKTSAAAAAVEALHMKHQPDTQRPLKVMVATSRNNIQQDLDESDKYRRLFVYAAKTLNEENLKEYFSEFGEIENVTIQRDRETWESKGFAYVTFIKFSDAAKAFEECDRKYKPKFAEPKGGTKKSVQSETAFESNIRSRAVTPLNVGNSLIPLLNVPSEGYTRIYVTCSPFLTYYHIKKLFDIVPGLTDCQYSVDLVGEFGRGAISYSCPMSAAYAVQKLNQFEYPPGSKLFVKPDYTRVNSRHQNNDISSMMQNLQTAMNNINSSAPDLAQLAEAIAQASKMIKVETSGLVDEDVTDSSCLNYCSVNLPPTKPLANIDSTVAKRCFLVCKPQPPPIKVLRDVFCRFGDLINVYTLPNKTVGYARYASVEAADEAIKLLHGAEICGIRVKVLEAEDEDKGSGARGSWYKN